jgi:very-short-patch-repair endonuclease
VRLTNEKIVARHVRSFALEELNDDFSWLMGELLEDIQNPAVLRRDRYAPLLDALRVRHAQIAAKAVDVFTGEERVVQVVRDFADEFEHTVQRWHEQVKRLHQEFHEYARIVSTRESEQKRRARERGYRELTTDREKAFVLSYLAEAGVLPSYQFPTDTFSLDPGVGDTPTLRRPAWIALFEFAPGNMVYANGHKLKSIRAFFEGRRRSGPGEQGADRAGRVERFCFCDLCGFAAKEVANNCPRCGHRISNLAEVALIDSFEAEENTQITSAEDSRQRLTFKREEHLMDIAEGEAKLYPYEFVTLEFRSHANLLVTNWGRQSRGRDQGEEFDLCPLCGRHRPHGMTENRLARWDEAHRGICSGEPRSFILGYEFFADVLILPLAPGIVPQDNDDAKAFCRTLGKALVVGAQERLEIEQDEIAYFQHPDGAGGWTMVFYETAPGGAGYLEQLAQNLPAWTQAAHDRLFKHDCERACYRCLKTARNQFDHASLNKELIRSVIFQLSVVQTIAAPRTGRTGDARVLSVDWLHQLDVERQVQPTSDTAIEKALLLAIREGGRLAEPVSQFEVSDGAGKLLTIPDFAYPDRRIAIYCDGFAYHGNRETLESDARKRNLLQAMGWTVLTFWGRQILRDPAACEGQIWQCYQFR